MNEQIPPTAPKTRPHMSRRTMILLLSALPIAALFALLGWGVARSGGNPGGLGFIFNSVEVPIEERPAPEFVVESLSGGIVDLSALRGKVVMVDFWNTSCPPCRREAPGLARVYKEYRDKNVEFIGVAIWDREVEVSRFVQEFDVTYPNVVDKRGRIGIDYGVRGVPEKYFIDAEGTLVKKFVGPTPDETMRFALDEILADSNSGTDGLN